MLLEKEGVTTTGRWSPPTSPSCRCPRTCGTVDAGTAVAYPPSCIDSQVPRAEVSPPPAPSLPTMRRPWPRRSPPCALARSNGRRDGDEARHPGRPADLHLRQWRLGCHRQSSHLRLLQGHRHQHDAAAARGEPVGHDRADHGDRQRHGLFRGLRLPAQERGTPGRCADHHLVVRRFENIVRAPRLGRSRTA